MSYVGRIAKIAPERVCHCGHSCQWHQQTTRTHVSGGLGGKHQSFDGARCNFPGCDCVWARWTSQGRSS